MAGWQPPDERGEFLTAKARNADDTAARESLSHVRHRLDLGRSRYGDRALSRPLLELLDELREEAADLGGWGKLARQVLDRHTTLSNARRLLDRIEAP